MNMIQAKNNLHPDCASMARSATKSRIESAVPAEIAIFYSDTTDLGVNYQDVIRYIPVEEQIRAEKFHFKEDRDTFVFSHAYLRIILALKLNIKPDKIRFIRDAFNKPMLEGLEYNFNITHTKNAFAIALSQYYNVGIDLENISRKADLSSIVKSYFSTGDQNYIEDPKGNSTERFFLLWTRKEALLKAIGVGITTDLTQYDVCNSIPDLNEVMLNEMDYYINCYNHHIYTKKIKESYLSIASPIRSNISISLLNSESFKTWE